MKNNTRILTLVFVVAFLTLLIGCFPSPTPPITENQAPIITSKPVETAKVGVVYTYDVNATDPDEDVLTYSLTTKPTNMTINSTTGVINWTPSFGQVGDNAVTVIVSDGDLSVTQSFTIKVSKPTPTPINHAPSITSIPNLIAIMGVEYIYDVEATDPDGDALTYSLTTKPNGMAIDSSTGVISWIPTAKGDYAVVVKVSDGKLSDTQSFTITVKTVGITEIVVLPETMTLVIGVSETVQSVTALYNIKADFEVPIPLGDCTYDSDIPSVATVSAIGEVTALDDGTATITVSYAGKEDTIEVTVVLPVHNTTKDLYYNTIQSAIDDNLAEPGDTIEVAAGTYDEQVIIDKSLTLQGVGDTTVIQPPAVELTATSDIPWIGTTHTMSAIVSVETAGGTVNIKNLKIDGSLIPSKATTWVGGLVYLETSGIVEGVTVIGNSILPDRTAGIFAAAITEFASLEVTGCTVIGYNRAGIYALGERFTADYHHNEINGPGEISTGVPNGMFFLEGANGSATYNTITDLGYIGEEYRSTGIGTYNAGTDVTFGYNTISFVQNAFALSTGTIGTIVEYNNIYDCHTGVRIEASAKDSIIQYNDIHDNDFAIRCGPEMGDGNIAHYNNFVDNPGLEWINVKEGCTYEGAVCNIHETYLLDARYNWWGSEFGPKHNGFPANGGDAVSDNVDYSNWSLIPY